MHIRHRVMYVRRHVLCGTTYPTRPILGQTKRQTKHISGGLFPQRKHRLRQPLKVSKFWQEFWKIDAIETKTTELRRNRYKYIKSTRRKHKNLNVTLCKPSNNDTKLIRWWEMTYPSTMTVLLSIFNFFSVGDSYMTVYTKSNVFLIRISLKILK